MEMPLVSVITPCYNGESYLERFLSSLLTQTYKNIEFIFVNDGSTDETEKIFELYKPKLEQRRISIRYIYQENKGQAAAINNGLQYFKGEYLMWPDSDDVLYPDNITKKVQFLNKNKDCGGVVVSGNIVKERNLKNIGILSCCHSEGKERIFNRLVFEDGVYFAPVGYMVRSSSFRDCIPSNCIYESKAGQNWQMFLPIAHKYKFGFVDETLFDYIVRDNSHSRKEKKYSENIKKTYIHEDCLFNVIQTIEMSETERNDLYYRIKIKYIRRRLQIAQNFFECDEANKYYNELKSKNELTEQVNIILKRANSRVYNFIFIFLLKLKIITKRILKYVFKK